jgi:Arc/MetJ-type ribon-helix-helix transcriptional regulator
VSKSFVETSEELLEGIDEMVREGFYATRSEGVNDAIRLLLKQYKLSKLHAKDTAMLGKAEREPQQREAAQPPVGGRG